MSWIGRISRLRGYGIFRNFTWPSDIPTFARYNLIYGWNGTGKTTLSRLFRDLEVGRAPTMGEAVLHINGSDVPGQSFPQSTLQVRVFNRDFIRETVFPVGSDDMPPILVLGAESVEKQREVERLKERRSTTQAKQESARLTEQSADEELDRFCIDCARLIKDTLRTSGQNSYNYYNKSRFQEDADEMAGPGDGIAHRLSDVERKRLFDRHKGAAKPKVLALNYTLPDFNAITDRLLELLTTTVVSGAIDALKRDPTLADWTRRGLRLHRDREAEQCLFCDHPLAALRLDSLEAHFNVEYERLLDCIGQEIRGCPNRSWRLRWLSVDSCYAATSFPSTGGVPSSSRCALSIQRSL